MSRVKIMDDGGHCSHWQPEIILSSNWIYMKKIILAFDGKHFSEGVIEFVRRLNELHPVLLTGVFLPHVQLLDLWAYSNGGDGAILAPVVESDEPEIIQENIKRFERFCQHNGIDYRVHKDLDNFSIQGLKKESCYADLLVLGAEVFYKNLGIHTSGDYLRDALHSAKCPILLVPEKFDFPQSIILAYDGTEDSVFAIKQFAYLFPELTDSQTLLVYANEDIEKDFPDRIQIEELAARHFSDLSLFKLDANPKKYFSTWISDKKSALLVSGSYGRSGLSQLFRRSFVKDIIADHQLPVFIAHK